MKIAYENAYVSTLSTYQVVYTKLVRMPLCQYDAKTIRCYIPH